MKGDPASTTVLPKGRFPGIAMAVFSTFGGILFGYDTGTISGILRMDDWLRTFGVPVPVPASEPGSKAQGELRFELPTAVESIVVSILFAGTFVGALLAGPAGDWLGRRRGIMASCLVFAFGVALQTGASHLPTFIVGRFFAGAGVGLVSTLVPMYQSECAPRWIRGAVVASYQWAITIGILVASVVDNATKGRKDHSAWRIPIAIQFVWASVLFSGMSVLPETPRWLMKRDWRMQAAKSLSRLSGLQEHDAKVQAELDQISASLSEERAFGQTTYRDCFRRSRNKIALRSITSILVLSLQQLIGVVFIGSYGTTFFANAGVENPFLVSVAVNVVQMGMTLPGIWGVERLGRRPLLIGGAIVMSICAYLVAILAVATPVRDLAPQRAVIALVSIFFAAYASTWGPVAWVVPSEIVPLNVRAKVVSLSVAIHWLCTWAVSFASPYLANSGPGDAGLGAKIFFIWGSTSAISAIFAFTCVPETKGLALEQIDALYKHSTPITSARCGKELILQGSNASSTENKRVEREGVEDISGQVLVSEEEKAGGSADSVSLPI